MINQGRNESEIQSSAFLAAFSPTASPMKKGSSAEGMEEVDALTEDDRNDLVAFSYLLQEQEDNQVDCFSAWAIEDVPVGLFSAPVDPVSLAPSSSKELPIATAISTDISVNTASPRQKPPGTKKRVGDDIESISAILVKYSEEKGVKTAAGSRKTKGNATDEALQNKSESSLPASTSQKRQKVGNKKKEGVESVKEEVREAQIIPLSLDENATHDHPSLKELTEIAKFPVRLFNSFNSGDLESLFQVIDECCTVNCAHRASSSDRVYVGREIIKEAFVAVAATFPDFVYLLKDAKLVRRVDGARILAVKTYFTGTRSDSRTSLVDEMYHDNYEEEVSHTLYDKSKMSADQIEQAKEITMRSREGGAMYRVFGKAVYHFALNKSNKIIEFFNTVSVHEFTPLEPQPPIAAVVGKGGEGEGESAEDDEKNMKSMISEATASS